MLKNKLKNIVFISIFVLFGSRVKAGDRYVVIAEASIPALTESAQSISKFSDQVAQGSSLLLAGGIIALSFQMHDINISSDLRVLLYADSSGKNPDPLIAFIARPAPDKTPSRIKFNHHKFPTKKIDDRFFIAESKELLDGVTTLPPELKTNSAVMVKFYPERYFSDCGGTIAAFKAKLEKEFSKGRKSHKKEMKGDIKVLESLLNQCETLTLNLNAAPNDLTLDLNIFPKESTPLSGILQKNQGTLSQDDIVKLSDQVAKSQNFVITDEIKSALSFLLSRIFKNSDTTAIAEKLCQFRISADKTKLNIGIGVTPKQAKTLLLATGVLKKQ
jgi:hypothetical protein